MPIGRVRTSSTDSCCSVVQPKETWPKFDKLGWCSVCASMCVCVCVYVRVCIHACIHVVCMHVLSVIESHHFTCNAGTTLLSCLVCCILHLSCMYIRIYRTDNGAGRIQKQLRVFDKYGDSVRL